MTVVIVPPMTEIKTKYGGVCKLLKTTDPTKTAVRFENTLGEPLVDFEYNRGERQFSNLQVKILTEKPVCFTDVEGCDKTYETCYEMFGNLIDMMQVKSREEVKEFDLRDGSPWDQPAPFSYYSKTANPTFKSVLMRASIGIHKGASMK